MSNVTPSDGNYSSSALKTSSEVEDELRRDAARLRRNQEAQIQETEAAYKKELSKAHKDFEKTASNMRETFGGALSNERQMSKLDREDMKRQVYDRFGRQANADITDANKKVARTVEELEALDSKQKSQLEAQNDYHRKQLNEIKSQYSDATERTTSAIRNTAEKERSTALRAQRMADQELREREKNRLTEMFRETESDFKAREKNYARDFDHARKSYQEKISEVENKAENALGEAAEQQQDELTQQANINRQGRAVETRELRRKVNEAAEFQRVNRKEAGDARAEVVREFESDQNNKLSSVQRSAQDEIGALKREVDSMSDRYATKTNEIISDKNRQFAESTGKMQKDFDMTNSFQSKVFNENLGQEKQRRTMDKAAMEKSLDRQMSMSSERLDRALYEQNRAAAETLHNVTTSKNTELNENKRQNSALMADGTFVPAMARERMEKNIEERYAKLQSAEFERNRDSAQSIKDSYAKRMRDAILDKDMKNQNTVRTLLVETGERERSLTDMVQETEFTKQIALRDAVRDRERQAATLQKNSANSIELQRRSFDETVAALSHASDQRLQSMRQELEFRNRMQSKEAAQRQNELIRNYEAKLSEQKTAFGDMMTQLRNESDSKLRETERKYRAALDEQDQSYKHQIKQSEAQAKEREKLVSQNHQEEIDRIRRANALLIQKKS